MPLNKTIILEKVYTNKMLNDAIRNIVDWRYREDFLSHFILQIANTKEDKLIQLYERGQLDWFCLRVMTNQWKSKNSTFWKIYRNNGFSGKNLIDFTDEEVSEDIEDDINELALVDEDILKQKIKLLLTEQYEDFYANQYHRTLFELYYFEKKNLRQISEQTDIKINSISRSIRKTKKYLKNKII